MKKKVLVLLFIIGCIFSGKAQQIGSGYASYITDFNTRPLSGLYQTDVLQTGFPETNPYDWSHLFVIRHSNPNNNFQMQLASSYQENDRLYFRKIAEYNLQDKNSTWYELATRGSNSFTGNQIINGEFKISGSGIEGTPLIIENEDKTQPGQANLWKILNMTGYYGNSLQFWAYEDGGLGCLNGGLCTSRLTLMDNGNIGIGTSSPQNKLEVNGSIRAKGVAVEGTMQTNGIEINGNIRISNSGIDDNYITLCNQSKVDPGQAHEWKILNMTGYYGNSLQFWAYDTLGCLNSGLCASRLTLMDNGNVGIGTSSPQNKLEVNGVIRAKEVIVENTNWPDHVFSSDYRLPSLETVSNHIKTNKHLPGVPSAEEVSEQGVNLSEMQAKLLQKIEELTLYIIQQDEAIQEMKNKLEKLENQKK